MHKNFYYLLIFQFLDILTGLIFAFYTNTFTSTKFKKGIFYKITVRLAVLVSFFIEKRINIKFLPYACNIFTGYEVLSIIENLGKLDINMNIFPDNVKKILLSFHEVEKEKEKIEDENKKALNN